MYGGGYIFNPDSEELTVEEEQIKLAEFEARMQAFEQFKPV